MEAVTPPEAPPMDLRALPSVDLLLGTPAAAELITAYGRALTTAAVRAALDGVRRRAADHAPVPDHAALLDLTAAELRAWTAPTLQPVLNATGVVLHTNLGRAPLSHAALAAVTATAAGYANLEFDLGSGKRGSRLIHAEALLQRLTGAEAALVVNNNAAAVLLALTALARRRGAVISRTQLVEVGGGFRIPDVMQQSGARLIEIGATNRVHARDYEAALESRPAIFVRAHRSNFRLEGFTSEPTLAEVAAIAHAAGLPLLDDLGSGTLLDTARYGLTHEPTVTESLNAGADLVCFSGDKLLGGPQAGILVGRAELIARLKRHPLARGVRADKLALAALSATLLHYLKDEAETHIPIWRMIAASPDALAARATAWVAALGAGAVLPGLSTVGGGSLPGETLPTALLALTVAKPDRFLAHLRAADPPIIARVQEDRVVFDPRTILPEQEPTFLTALAAVLPTVL
jgi:L-seryl-tRNA(Ser) seleniumtransferase